MFTFAYCIIDDKHPSDSSRLVATLVHSVARHSLAAATTFQPVPVPVESAVVVGVALRTEQVSEHATQVGNVWLGLKLQTTAVRQVLGELTGASLAERRNGDGLCFFSMMSLYFLVADLALSPCQGRPPLRK